MAAIKNMCKRVVWLSHGKVVQAGPAEEVVKQFETFMNVEHS
jgi:ABC-type polysaccharide/polyol phosphate transport system ATPase subunit